MCCMYTFKTVLLFGSYKDQTNAHIIVPESIERKFKHKCQIVSHLDAKIAHVEHSPNLKANYETFILTVRIARFP